MKMAPYGPDFFNRSLKEVDEEITLALWKELKRQQNNLELIASENFVSRAVLEATGSIMTNKYAEGYPGKRYYGGCEFVDVAEKLARKRAKELFKVNYANVQPHSGTQANTAVYIAFLEPGDTVLGMNLSDGGHLSHGHPINISGKLYNFVSYGVLREDERIDYEGIRKLCEKHKPKMIVCGASAYPREIDFAKFGEIAREFDAILMADIAHIAGLVAAGLHMSPAGHAHVFTTTTHKTLRGPRGGMILSSKEFAKKINSAVFPGIQGGPLMHVIAAKAVALKEALTDEFKEYQRQIVKNAKTLAETLKERGFRLVSGGTDNHLMLVDLRPKKITGKEAQNLLESVNITVNKNTIPFETESPFVTSGIRIGTPAVTTRGMKEEEMKLIGNLIADAIENRENEEKLKEIKEKVLELTHSFPMYEFLEKIYSVEGGEP